MLKQLPSMFEYVPLGKGFEGEWAASHGDGAEFIFRAGLFRDPIDGLKYRSHICLFCFFDNHRRTTFLCQLLLIERWFSRMLWLVNPLFLCVEV